MDDSTLIRRILARDRRALYVFYHRFSPRLEKYIKYKISSAHDAEEVVQDCLFSFLESLRDFEGRSSIATFLFAIARNKVIDYYRRKKIKHLVFSQVPSLEKFVSPLLSPEEELDFKVLKGKVSIAFSRLMPKYKKVLIAKYTEGRSVAEIAEKMTTSVKSAESVLFRARKAFVKEFVAI